MTSRGSLNMRRSLAAALFASLVWIVNVAPVHATPCGEEIARFEKAVRASQGNPDAGPAARQSVGAQLGRQPTPESVERSGEKAKAAFDAAMARAKRLDAEGKRAACLGALGQAKKMYNLR
jgi:hypothetical protein